MLIPKEPVARPGGHFKEGLFCGVTRRRDTGSPRAFVCRENHWNIFGRNGSAKFVSNGAFVSAFNRRGGGLFISPKSDEWTNFGVQRGADPRLWERSQSLGRSLGVNPVVTRDPPRVTASWFVPNGRCFIVAPENDSQFEGSCWNPLMDCGIAPEGAAIPEAWSRLIAVCGSPFPAADPGSNRDSFWWQSPTAALAAASAFILCTDPRPGHWNLAYALRWVLGYDENPGRFGYDEHGRLKVAVGSPLMQQVHFREMAMASELLDGQVAMAGNALLQMGEKTFGGVNAELQAKANFLVDPRYQRVMGRSDFSLEEIGADPEWPVSAYFSPVAGEGEEPLAFLRMAYRLGSQIFLKRDFKPEHPIVVVGDEIGSSWGRGLRHEVLNLHTYGRFRNVMCINYWQDLSQTYSALGREGAQTALANSAQMFFGGACREGREYLRERLGEKTIHIGGFGRQRERRQVELASSDAIDRDLNMGSSLAYVLPSSSRPVCVRRVAFKTIRTPEGAVYEGLPGVRGHYSEF
ncbi:type IV secretory system conjugative DNA transfer family protein [Botrimarina mediterranea]|uniref:Type IV secretory system Conjugative DNA transfer n=1 Tax=Botrimarina mediterranea TaxID=2528022 RepID=A0A518K275_9BACT|nr:TraM recognition domain-containing protein [Botrimarina mediterranea]QDV71869.1 Type IV secretory system Conjugative DNA transfer [Botrimarina mediterranea]